MSNIAISYARFSSIGQAEGFSLQRQSENAEEYARANGLILDRKLSFRDLGVSAYDQSNVRKGALGLFLKAVEEKKIPIGSTLIIESFDRLSRAKPMDALGIFSDIINAGMNVVTLTKPPKVFSRATIDANVFQLFEALIDMQRAHGESERKSELGSKSWVLKKQIANTGALMTAKVPYWIDVVVDSSKPRTDPTKRSASLNPERSALVRRIIDMAKQNMGNHTIVKTLNAEEVPPWSQSIRRRKYPPNWTPPAPKWQPSYIQKVLKNPALYGAIELDGELVEKYYPALVDKGEFIYLQSLRAGRSTTTNRNRKGETITNLFTGLLACGYCGSKMNIAGYKSRVNGYERKYVGCHGARTAATQCKMKVWFMDELEPVLLFWLTSLDYSKFVGGPKKGTLEVEKEQLAMLEADLATANKRVENTMEAIAEFGAKTMVPRLHQYEAAAAGLHKRVKAQREKVAVLDAQDGAGASRMKGLFLLFKALKTTTDPVQLRALREQLMVGIAEVTEKITLFPAGRSLDGPKEDRYIEVAFRNGTARTIDPGEC